VVETFIAVSALDKGIDDDHVSHRRLIEIGARIGAQFNRAQIGHIEVTISSLMKDILSKSVTMRKYIFAQNCKLISTYTGSVVETGLVKGCLTLEYEHRGLWMGHRLFMALDLYHTLKMYVSMCVGKG
jgi:hypothetical protein